MIPCIDLNKGLSQISYDLLVLKRCIFRLFKTGVLAENIYKSCAKLCMTRQIRRDFIYFLLSDFLYTVKPHSLAMGRVFEGVNYFSLPYFSFYFQCS